jgi:hypothetical protein
MTIMAVFEPLMLSGFTETMEGFGSLGKEGKFGPH